MEIQVQELLPDKLQFTILSLQIPDEPCFFMFIAVYTFRHIVPLLYLKEKQVEDSENIYGVLIVIVKAQPHKHKYQRPAATAIV